MLCASPWNLDISSTCLQRTWLGRAIYSRTMGKNMKKLFEQWVAIQISVQAWGICIQSSYRNYAELCKNPLVDVEAVRQSSSLQEFDRSVEFHLPLEKQLRPLTCSVQGITMSNVGLCYRRRILSWCCLNWFFDRYQNSILRLTSWRWPGGSTSSSPLTITNSIRLYHAKHYHSKK